MGNTQKGSTKNNSLAASLTPRQKLLCQETLELMKDDLPKLGIIVFTRFFETEPSMKRVFPKIVQINDSNQLELNTDYDILSRHASTVMHSLGAAVESLDHEGFFEGIIKNIGQSHQNRNVTPRMIEKLWPSLSYGLKQVLKDSYTKEVAVAWKKVFFYLCRQMKIGMKGIHVNEEDSSLEKSSTSY